jgi:hypothetical protein
MRLRLVCGVAVVALAASACGSEEEAAKDNAAVAAATTGAPIDPCSLVSADEVGEVIGDSIVATKPADGRCTYETADAMAASVTVEVDTKDAENHMKVERDTAKVLGRMGKQAADEGGAAGQDVNVMLNSPGGAPALGDEALFDVNSRLSVRKGTIYLAVEPPMMRSRIAGGSGSPLLSGDDKKKMAVAIAEKALAKLP